MTIDQRIEFLVQSTESLHQTVHEMSAQIQKHSEQLEIDGQHILKIAEAVLGLKNIAEAHEERLSDLEGGEPAE